MRFLIEIGCPSSTLVRLVSLICNPSTIITKPEPIAVIAYHLLDKKSGIFTKTNTQCSRIIYNSLKKPAYPTSLNKMGVNNDIFYKTKPLCILISPFNNASRAGALINHIFRCSCSTCRGSGIDKIFSLSFVRIASWKRVPPRIEVRRGWSTYHLWTSPRQHWLSLHPHPLLVTILNIGILQFFIKIF